MTIPLARRALRFAFWMGWAPLFLAPSAWAGPGLKVQTAILEPALPEEARKALNDPLLARPTLALADVLPRPGLELCFLWQGGALQVFGASARGGFEPLGVQLFEPKAAGSVSLDFGRVAGSDREAVFVLEEMASKRRLTIWRHWGANGFAEKIALDLPPAAALGAEADGFGAFDGAFAWLDFAQDIDGDGLDDVILAGDGGPIFLLQRPGPKLVPLAVPALKSRAVARVFYASLSENAKDSATSPPTGRVEFSASAWAGPLAIEDFTGDKIPDLLALQGADDGEFSAAASAPSRDEEEGGILLGRLWRGERVAGEPGFRFVEPPLELRLGAASSDPNARLLDLNRDGTLDLLTIWSNLDAAAPLTRLAFYDGAKQRRLKREGVEILSFKLPTRVIRSRDPAGLCLLSDFDRDGFRDVALTHFSYLFGSVSEMAAAFLEEEGEYALRVYRGGPAGLSEEASASARLTASMEVFSTSLAPPIQAGGDFDGDGREELLARRSERLFEIRALPTRGEAASALATIEIPGGRRRLSAGVADLDGNGRVELLFSDDGGGWLMVCFFE